ncbi:Mitochondrial Carrier (MC) Family [Thraustotheca clavata]|uniref:Mitochondrial Carrier (MC) Family n=1 Tax=Thraustotheca clavata TaxID=74557 RepID=A0A1W0A1Z9_9STRA|nr:Mitochondrial Carrier (MC) Family [Thraustotheca clavata]
MDHPTLFQHIIAGSVSGMSSVVVCHPLDTIRTRLQHASSRSFSNVVLSTVRNEGLKGLYSGFFPPFFSQAVYKSVIFTTQSKVRSVISTTLIEPSPLFSTIVSGTIAGGLNATLVAPVELVRNRLQIQGQTSSTQYSGTFDVIAKVIKREGFLALWKGLSATIMRDSLGVGLYFVGFDLAKTHLPNDWNPTLRILTAGAIGGISFWSIALPFDTVKTVIQVNPHSKQGLIATGMRLIRTEGFGRVFYGWQAAFSRGIPGAAITFYAYDKTMSYLVQN